MQKHAPRPLDWRNRLVEFAGEPLAVAILLLVMISGAVLYWNLSRLAPQRAAMHQPVVPKFQPHDAGHIGAGRGLPQQQERVIARLIRSAEASWDQPDAPADGTALRLGQQLALKSGLAQIAFDSGATVVLEGPALLELGVQRKHAEETNADNSCDLRFGKLVARVSESARGFVVDTPSMRIEDLGTEFCVSVTPANQSKDDPRQATPSVLTEVHVLRGAVTLTPQPIVDLSIAESRTATAETQILRAGEAITRHQDGALAKVAPARPEKFVRELPAAPVVPSASPFSAGDILVVCRYTLKLVKIDPKTGKQTLLAQGDPQRHGPEWLCVVVDSQHQVYVGTEINQAADGGQVLRINPSDGSIAVVSSGRMLSQARINSLIVGGEGKLLAVQDGRRDQILSIHPRTGEVTRLVEYGDNAWSIALDRGGRDLFIVSDGGPTGLALYAHGHVTPWVKYEDPRNYRSVAVDQSGRVFVSYVLDGARAIAEVDRRTHGLLPVVNLPPAHAPLGQMATEGATSLVVGSYSDKGEVFRVDVASKTAKRLAEDGHLQASGGVAVVPDLKFAADAQKGMP